MADLTRRTRPPRGGTQGGVLRNVRPYLCFFVALLLIQTLYSVLFLCVATDTETVRREVTDRYDYELEFHSMTQPQYADLYNQCGEAPPEDEVWRPYSSVRYEKDGDYYNAYVTLRGSSTADAMLYFNHLYRVEGIEPTESPLYAYHDEYLPSIIGYTVLCVLVVFAVSLFLLVRLYRTRTDRDTFAFGIYMTCGATFSRLYRHAAGELLLIGSLTFLPAFAAGLGITAALYSSVGVTPHGLLPALLLSLALSLLTVLCAVLIPIARLSRKTPVSLLSAKDNTPYVASPRRSFRIFDAAYPRSYTLISLWRYRRYYALLLLSSVLLPVLFLIGCTLSDIQTTYTTSAEPDFTVTFAPEKVNTQILLENTAELSEQISSIEGVGRCELESITTAATMRTSHMLVPDQAAAMADPVTVPYRRALDRPDAASYRRATNLYTYEALDEAAIASLKAQYTDIEGDLRSVLTGDRTVVVAESLGNDSPFDFSVGDVILVAVEASDLSIIGYTDTLGVLEQQLRSGRFVYEEFTVGAVIRDTRAASTVMLGVGFDAYRRLTESEPVRASFDVYLKDGLDFPAYETVSEGIYDAAFEYYHCKVDNHHVFFSRYLTQLRVLDGRTLLLALSFCLMALLISFYSQRVFYEKRVTEWGLLRAMGSTERQISRMFTLTSLVLAAVSALLTLALSLLANALVYKLAYEWLPSGGFVSRVAAEATVPWAAVAPAIVISLICAVVPPLVAQRRAAKGRNQLMGGLVHVSEKR